MQNFAMGEADSNQFMQSRTQLVIATENFGRHENLSPVLIPTMSKDIDGQLKLAHKVVEVVDKANRKICVALLWYSVEKLESSYAQVPIFARKKEDEKFQHYVYVNNKFEDIVYLLDVTNSVYDNFITIQPICNVL